MKTTIRSNRAAIAIFELAALLCLTFVFTGCKKEAQVRAEKWPEPREIVRITASNQWRLKTARKSWPWKERNACSSKTINTCQGRICPDCANREHQKSRARARACDRPYKAGSRHSDRRAERADRSHGSPRLLCRCAARLLGGTRHPRPRHRRRPSTLNPDNHK